MGILIHGTKIFENDEIAVYEVEAAGGGTRGTVAVAKSDRARFLAVPDGRLDELATRIVGKAHQAARGNGSWPTHVNWAS